MSSGETLPAKAGSSLPCVEDSRPCGYIDFRRFVDDHVRMCVGRFSIQNSPRGFPFLHIPFSLNMQAIDLGSRVVHEDGGKVGCIAGSECVLQCMEEGTGKEKWGRE